jgi:phosphoglycerol transferase MdoB-like AlkP superfamily enzyme
LHGYASAFYDRRNWWPALGIQEAYFAEKFKSFGMPICGNQFFRSVCDTAIASWIFSYAGRNPGRKEFFYWVTVNTHLPLQERKEESFRAFYTKWKKSGVDNETLRLCYEFRAFFADLAKKCSDTFSPKMHVLLIGDHAPPYIDPDLRKLFSATQVPYVELLPAR